MLVFCGEVVVFFFEFLLCLVELLFEGFYGFFCFGECGLVGGELLFELFDDGVSCVEVVGEGFGFFVCVVEFGL